MVRLAIVLAMLATTACSSSKDIIRRQQEEIAQLRVQNEELRDRVAGGAVQPERIVEIQPCDEQACVGETITVLLTDLYFESGSATLTADGVARLADVAATIRGQYGDRRIRVEGHTDSNPIGASLKNLYPSNWELSASRAAAVVRHFQWTHRMDPARFEVVGFGHHMPVGSNSTAEGRKQNRRVRIAVLPE